MEIWQTHLNFSRQDLLKPFFQFCCLRYNFLAQISSKSVNNQACLLYKTTKTYEDNRRQNPKLTDKAHFQYLVLSKTSILVFVRSKSFKLQEGNFFFTQRMEYNVTSGQRPPSPLKLSKTYYKTFKTCILRRLSLFSNV